MSIARRYTKELRQETNYSATWFPIVRIRPGDVGRLAGYEYVHVTTLQYLGFPFDVEEGTVNARFDYLSKGAVDVDVKVFGDTPAGATPASLGVKVSFKRAAATLFSAAGCRSLRIRDLKGLGDAIMQKAEQGEWERDYVVITEVITADSATILIASEAGAEADLIAKGKVTTGAVVLADAAAGFELVGHKQMSCRFVGETEVTPLFRASAVKRRFLRSSEFRGPATEPAEEAAVEFSEVDYDDFAK